MNTDEYSVYKTLYGMGGKSVLMKCKIHKKCPAMLKQFMPSHNESTAFFYAYKHNQISKSPIEPSVAKKIKEFFDLGVTKPDEILRNLRNQKFEEPKKGHLKYFLQKLRKERDGNSSNLNDLKEWAEPQMILPEDGNSSFDKLSI